MNPPNAPGGQQSAGTQPLRIALWAAVSSAPQAAEDKNSLDHQLTTGRQFAAAVGGTIVATYTVPGHSRDLIFWQDAERTIPAYRQLKEDTLAHRFDLLWALDIDRLGRDPALSNQVLSLIEKNGAEVYLDSAPHPIGHKTTGHRYISAIQSVRASEDQTLRVHRQRQGMRARVRKRGLIANNPPRGYQPTRDPHTGAVTAYTFTPEIQIIQRISDLFLAGHSYAEIRRRLVAATGLPFSYNSIRYILSNDTYAGLPSWEGSTASEPSPHVPALWDPPTHAAIIRERQRRQRAPYHRKGSGPLTGVAYCHRCQRPMTRFRTSRQWHLRCTTETHHAHTDRRCHTNNLPESTALHALAQHLQQLTTTAALDLALAQLQHPAGHQRLTADLDRTLSSIENITAQRHRLALALAAGHMAPDIYHTADTQLLAQLHTAEQQAAELQRHLAALPDPAQQKTALAALANAFPQLLRTAEPAELSTLLQSAGLRVYCESGAVHHITP